MCNPLLIVSGAAAGLQLMQKQDEADSVNAAGAQQAVNINKATVDSYEQINRQGVEDAQNQAVEQNRLRQETASRLATAKTSAAASGVEGLSVDALLMNLSGKGLQAGTTSDMNYLRQQEARKDQSKGITTRATSELNSIQRAPGVGLVDVVGGGLKVAGAYYGQQAAEKAATRRGM